MVFDSRQAATNISGSAGFSNINLCDLVRINLASASVQRLVSGLRIRGVWMSPRGDYAAITVFKGFGPKEGFDLELVPLASGEPRVLTASLSMEYGINVSWSPQGDSLAYIADGEIYKVNAASGAASKVTTDNHPAFSHSYRSPIWSSDGKFLYLIGDNQLFRITVASARTESVGSRPNFEINEIAGPKPGSYASADGSRGMLLKWHDAVTFQSGFASIDLVSGIFRRLIAEPKRYGRPEEGLYTTTATADGRIVLYVAEDAAHPPDLWRIDVSKPQPQQLTHLNPKLDEFELGECRVIDYQDDKGAPLRAALLLPAGYETGKRYPMITWVYGGASGSAAVRTFGLDGQGIDNMQFFATRGFAVLYPDTPLRTGTPVQDLVKSVIPAVRKAVELGIADPARVGVMGHSYGGYSVLSLISHTNIFQAAIARAAQADLISAYLGFRDATGDAVMISWAEQGPGRMGGSLWDYRDRYIDNSPIFDMDHVRTPLLLLHGSQDQTVPSYLADQVFVALRRLGKDVTYVKYLREDHWEGDWNFADMQDALNRILQFFDTHLKSGEQK